MRSRIFGLVVLFLLIATVACGGGGETPAPTSPPEPTTPPEPTEPAVVATDPPPSVSGLDFTLDPNFGAEDLDAGFSPDPYETTLVSGGNVDVFELDLASGCTGYATSSPDFRINWTGSADQLRIFFVADDADDTTLIVNTADGDWMCNDDYDMWNPMVELDSPMEGQYDIWVGSYSPDEFIQGTLYITEGDLSPEDFMEQSSSGGGDGGELDYMLEPNFGTEDLEAGFSPDPYEIVLVSGGTVDIDELDLGSGCLGYATSSPDFRVNWTGSADQLRIFFVADEEMDDTTLVINTADGDWMCNDDEDMFNPMVEIENPMEGQYDIWVGSYSSDEFVQGTLYVTEGDYDPGNLP